MCSSAPISISSNVAGQILFLKATSSAQSLSQDQRYSTRLTERSRATLARAYAATAKSVSSCIPAMTASLTSAGSLLLTHGACQITGQLSASPMTNPYAVSATLSASCPSPAGAYAGHAFQNYGTGNVYVMLVDQNGGNGTFLHLFDPPA